ncbi:MAG: S8 family peptidase [Hyphomonadaceae bacterium]
MRDGKQSDGTSRGAKVHRPVRASLLISLALASTACASGGGGGNGSPLPPPVAPPVSPPTTPPSPPVVPPPPPPPASSFETSEYFAGSGSSSPRVSALSFLHASSAYAQGGTGAGITVAVIDTNIDPTITAAGEELAGKISGASKDIFASTRAAGDVDSDAHAAFVSSVIAANKDGRGTQGIAFDAQILHVRADTPGSCQNTDPDNGGCSFSDNAIAQGIDYAVSKGVKVVNLSLGGEIDSDPTLENAIRRAVSAGVLVVIAAGNDAEPPTGSQTAKGTSPLEPAYIAGEAASLGRVVAVGAVNLDGDMASFSNRAGATKDFYILAPGATRRDANGNVINGVAAAGPDDNKLTPDLPDCSTAITTDCNDLDDRGDYYYVSGTSFAAPFVAGALAMMLEAFPNLSPETALQAILMTADDYVTSTPDPIRGEVATTGTDEVSGVGIMNLERAFSPIGTTSMTFDGTKVSLAQALAPASGALGDWVSHAGAFNGLVFQDVLDRGFRIGEAPAATGRAPFVDMAEKARILSSRTHAVGFGGAAFSWSLAPTRPYDPRTPWEQEPEAIYQINMSFGSTDIAAGKGGAPEGMTPIMTLINDPSGPNQLATGTNWSYVSHTVGATTLDFRASRDSSRSGASFGIGVGNFESGKIRLGFGSMKDERTTLGGQLQSRFGGVDQSQVTATTIEGQRAIGNWTLSGSIEAGRAGLSGANVDGLWTSAWTVSAERAFVGGALRLTAAQPRRAEGGKLVFDAPIEVGRDGTLRFEQRTVELTPSGRQLSLEAGWRARIDAHTTFEAAAAVATSPHHVANAKPESALWLGLRRYW